MVVYGLDLTVEGYEAVAVLDLPQKVLLEYLKPCPLP